MKVVIFDFDGTIADSWEKVVEIICKLSGELVNRKLTKDDVQKLRNKKTQELFKEFGISLIKLPFIIKKVRSEFTREIESIKPIKGIRNTLRHLKKASYKLGILTSNSEENIKMFIDKNSFDFFDFIYSGSSVFGKDKVIKSCLKDQGLKPGQVVYVGDETRDIEAAKKSNVQIIAVSWGFHSRENLARENPDFLIDKPEELVEILS